MHPTLNIAVKAARRAGQIMGTGAAILIGGEVNAEWERRS